MPLSFIRRHLTVEAEFYTRLAHMGFVVEKVAPHLLSPRPGHFGPPPFLFHQCSTTIIHSSSPEAIQPKQLKAL